MRRQTQWIVRMTAPAAVVVAAVVAAAAPAPAAEHETDSFQDTAATSSASFHMTVPCIEERTQTSTRTSPASSQKEAVPSKLT